MAKKEVKQNKDKKHFFKDFKAELKKVSWPTPKQLLNNTAVVVVIVLITALIVFILDVVFDFANKYGITKLQTVVQEEFSNNETEEIEEDSEDSLETELDNEENYSNETTIETDEQSNESEGLNESETSETQE